MVMTMMKLHKAQAVVVALVARLNHIATKRAGVHPAPTECTVQIITGDRLKGLIIVQTIAHGRVAHRLNQMIPNYLIVQSKQSQKQKSGNQ